jgi:hypothetical protein
MIVRDFSFDVIDSTTNTYQPFDRRTDTLILAPLDRYKIRIKDRYFVVIEPLQGNLDEPDPNAFVTAYSGSWGTGNTFSLNLLGQDFEQEGFSVGDEVFVYLQWGTGNAVFRCTIIGQTGASATFRINQAAGGAPDIQNPIRAIIILLSDRSEIKPSFHFGNNSGPNSPLSAIPFTSPHADHIIAYSSIDPADLPSPLTYNLQKYSSLEPTIVSLGTLLLGYSPLDFRRRAIIVEGTQFYAYRTNLDPQAQAPTSLYSLDGRIEVLLQAPTPVRDAPLTLPCLLLHPNRKGRTLNFLSPGTLTIAGGNYTLTPPSGFTPIRSVLAVTGRDSDHPRLDIADSLALTNPVTGASGPAPTITNRPGAEFVGVMIGQDGGKWVAVMTNKEPAVTPSSGNWYVQPHFGEITRYDSFVGLLTKPNISGGIYIVQTLIKIANNFIPIDEVEYNTTDVVLSPYPPISPTHAALSNVYPYPLGFQNWPYFNPTNFDFAYFASNCLIFIPVPSRRQPPLIATALTQPNGGYGLDLNNWANGPITLKWRLFTPDGDVIDSNELTFPSVVDTANNVTMYFAPDNQIATITETPSHVYINHPQSITPNNLTYDTFIRVVVFQRPEGYKPVLQKMLYIEENFQLNTINEQHSEGSPSIVINRIPFVDFTAYQIILDKTALPPGNYTIHVRHHVFATGLGDYYTTIERESYFYDFAIPAPPEPPSGPPLAPDFCIPKIPAVAGEDWNGLYRDENGEWQTFSAFITGCELENYCGCFELTSVVPDTHIDIMGYFRGAIHGKVIPDGTKHKARFRGRIIRLADEYATEDFVSSLYKAEDIVRAYTQKYQIELFLQTPCDLANLDLLKFAWKWDVTNRSNKLLPSLIRDLRPGEVDISDSGVHVKATITLRTLTWRDEYRRQG